MNASDKGFTTFESWLLLHPDKKTKYDEIINGSDAKALQNKYISDIANISTRYQLPATLVYKTGGKVEKTTSKKQMLSVNDRLTLQGDKAAKRAVLQASDNLHKMLLKLIK